MLLRISDASAASAVVAGRAGRSRSQTQARPSQARLLDRRRGRDQALDEPPGHQVHLYVPEPHRVPRGLHDGRRNSFSNRSRYSIIAPAATRVSQMCSWSRRRRIRPKCSCSSATRTLMRFCSASQRSERCSSRTSPRCTCSAPCPVGSRLCFSGRCFFSVRCPPASRDITRPAGSECTAEYSRPNTR